MIHWFWFPFFFFVRLHIIIPIDRVKLFSIISLYMDHVMCTYFPVSESLTQTWILVADSKFKSSWNKHKIREPRLPIFEQNSCTCSSLRWLLIFFLLISENIRVPSHAWCALYEFVFPFPHDLNRLPNNFTCRKTIRRRSRTHLPSGLTNSFIHTFEMIQLYVNRIPSSAQRLFFTLKRT